MMLFLVGMELDPKGLWAMRVSLMGWVVSGADNSRCSCRSCLNVFGTCLANILGRRFNFRAFLNGDCAANPKRKRTSKTEGGRNVRTLGVFQDIAVILMLALIPLLALPEQLIQEGGSYAEHSSLSLVEGMPGWLHGLVVVVRGYRSRHY